MNDINQNNAKDISILEKEFQSEYIEKENGYYESIPAEYQDTCYVTHRSEIERIITGSLNPEFMRSLSNLVYKNHLLEPFYTMDVVVECNAMIETDNGSSLVLSDAYDSVITEPRNYDFQMIERLLGRMIAFKLILVNTDGNMKIYIHSINRFMNFSLRE